MADELPNPAQVALNLRSIARMLRRQPSAEFHLWAAQCEQGADLIEQWRTASLLKIRTRRAIEERLAAGDTPERLAEDYGVPVAFITTIGAPGYDILSEPTGQRAETGDSQ